MSAKIGVSLCGVQGGELAMKHEGAEPAVSAMIDLGAMMSEYIRASEPDKGIHMVLAGSRKASYRH